MRSTLLLPITVLLFTAPAHAQSITRDEAIAEIRELVLTKRPMSEWPARNEAIGQWLVKIETDDVELADHAFLVGVAKYFVKDYTGAAQQLMQELERQDGNLPTRDFDNIIGRVLMADAVRAIREQQFGEVGARIRYAARLYEDPAMVYRAASSSLARAEDATATDVLDGTLRAMFADDRLTPSQRQAVLRAVYSTPAGARGAAEPKATATLKPFTAKDLDGNQISLEKLEGKVILVDFWATWCGPCLREMPHVVAVHRRHADDGFEVIGISLDSEPAQQRGGPVLAPEEDSPTVAKIRQVMAELGMDWPVVYEGGKWETRLAQENGIRSIPATFLIDRSGKLRYTNLRGDSLAQRVAELCAEAPGRD